jgi:hypothetical protein
VPNCLRSVMAGLDPAIHVSREIREEMESSPGMTRESQVPSVPLPASRL